MTDIDWNQVLIEASISAMQGLQENGKMSLFIEAAPKFMAKLSVEYGKELVKELKKEIAEEKN